MGERLQALGREFGTTTGRKRRCGWLDLVVVKYSHIINGYTSLALTKLDVLDAFEEIRIGVAYRHNGALLRTFPADLAVLSAVEVDYLTLPGWRTPIGAARSFEQLPAAAQEYARTIERVVGLPGTRACVPQRCAARHGARLVSASPSPLIRRRRPVRWIGVGPARDAIVQRF